MGNIIQKSFKRGLAFNLTHPDDFESLKEGVSWWYNWHWNTAAPENYYQDYQMEFIPMLWAGNTNDDDIDNSANDDTNYDSINSNKHPKNIDINGDNNTFIDSDINDNPRPADELFLSSHSSQTIKKPILLRLRRSHIHCIQRSMVPPPLVRIAKHHA